MTATPPNATTLPAPTTIEFDGAQLIAIVGTTPTETFVAMKPIAEAMGLSWQPQHSKLKTHPVLSKGITEIMIPSSGGAQAMTALSLTRLPYWFATLNSNKVPNPDTRAKIIAFQERCADYLFEMLFGPATVPTIEHQPAEPEPTLAFMAALRDLVNRLRGDGVTTLAGLRVKPEDAARELARILDGSGIPEPPPICNGCAAKDWWNGPSTHNERHPLRDGPITNSDLDIISHVRSHIRAETGRVRRESLADAKRVQAEAGRMAEIRKLLGEGV